jgi:hypothetical protein
VRVRRLRSDGYREKRVVDFCLGLLSRFGEELIDVDKFFLFIPQGPELDSEDMDQWDSSANRHVSLSLHMTDKTPVIFYKIAKLYHKKTEPRPYFNK